MSLQKSNNRNSNMSLQKSNNRNSNMSLHQAIIDNMSEEQKRFCLISETTLPKQPNTKTTPPKQPNTKLMSSVKLEQKAAGYLLAFANARKKGL